MVMAFVALVVASDLPPKLDVEKALKRIARAKSISFNLDSAWSRVSLPADIETTRLLTGDVYISKDGSWSWRNRSGRTLAGKGAKAWLTTPEHPAKVETKAVDEAGNPLSLATIRKNVPGLELFISGKTAGWIVLPMSKKDQDFRVVGLARPGRTRKEVLAGEPSAATYLYLDISTGLPTHASMRTAGSADWDEYTANFKNFKLNPKLQK
jgi:hypothetical protein